QERFRYHRSSKNDSEIIVLARTILKHRSSMNDSEIIVLARTILKSSF
ncbi:2894_t:CDS:1, partial [Funneliformis caledonium]